MAITKEDMELLKQKIEDVAAYIQMNDEVMFGRTANPYFVWVGGKKYALVLYPTEEAPAEAPIADENGNVPEAIPEAPANDSAVEEFLG